MSHPDRVLYPEQGITKRDLAEYYVRVAERMLPHVIDRPLVLVRCPQGHTRTCFFQKHPSATLDAPLRAVTIREKQGSDRYVVVDDAAGLVALVQMGVLEVHVWGARVDRMEQPDRIVFDLDPGPGVAWPFVVESALRLRERLEELGLASFVKTTGGKGLHVVVPLARRAGWKDVRTFADAVASRFVREDPSRFTTMMSKARRPGRIFIDTLRNVRGSTWVAPYSTRRRPGAPVSMPIEWREVTARLAPDAFTIAEAASRLRRADPWRGMDDTRQSLTQSMLRTVASRP